MSPGPARAGHYDLRTLETISVDERLVRLPRAIVVAEVDAIAQRRMVNRPEFVGEQLV